ncbi:putative LRR receptor-like serine/threonine-protein kinase RKF3 [Hibiscus syriacus]|uniref:LRR receptor-like serine/threonine-protein kinase RKF3 n=1 Tax=Hibiscus syriacus TaxID=106335 RepID=A0A6A2YHB8_HIBSY|nr:putative LRR receptor-like serine/threonine-protein kinase RKF3 [Hibiscus syriacus]
MSLTTNADFEALIPNTTLISVALNCNQSLNGTACASCTRSLANLQAFYSRDSSISIVSGCVAYPSIYAAGAAIYWGATETASCLFSIGFLDSNNGKDKSKGVSLSVLIGVGVGLAVLVGVCLFGFRKHRDSRKKRRDRVRNLESGSESDSIGESTDLVKFTFDEIKEATGNFSIHNIIGRGGYGNVYKGYLSDGSEVALKRFKNCSTASDANFKHEVEVIASVRHVNLVALRGYCTAATPLKGHQRKIV